MSSLQQFLPHLFAMLRLSEFIHNRPLMNPEAVRQLQQRLLVSMARTFRTISRCHSGILF
jgi:hypothetical protein